MALGRPREHQEEDFIKPEDIGMNSKAVHHQLQNAMQRQIERQKIEIIALNSTILQLKQKDKSQVGEISRLTNIIAELEFQLMEGESRKKPLSSRQAPAELQEENRRLRTDLQETQELIKKILLEREKERMFTFHN
ncbi:MAG: hypothetical protein JST59_01495 [Actinobacteria bacterium]|nr:hypothetical protein [Actinomycetota bacterium]